MKKTTDEILNDIKRSEEIDYDENNKTSITYELILKHLEKSNLTKAELIKGVGLDIKNGYKYLSGDRKINRDMMIKFLIYLNLDYQTLNQELKLCGFAELYPRVKRDKIIIHKLIHGYSLDQINDTLSSEGQFRL